MCTVRGESIDHLQPCMTDIYLHIVARMASYIAAHACTSLISDPPRTGVIHGWCATHRPQVDLKITYCLCAHVHETCEILLQAENLQHR